jgi:hypothetical protein
MLELDAGLQVEQLRDDVQEIADPRRPIQHPVVACASLLN